MTAAEHERDLESGVDIFLDGTVEESPKLSGVVETPNDTAARTKISFSACHKFSPRWWPGRRNASACVSV